MILSRRHLLVGAAALALWPRPVFAAAVDQTAALLALLPDRAAAARLGEAWVRQEHLPAGEVLQRLQQRVAGGDPGKLRDAVAEDFRSGAVVKIEGWQIARTQAELCALAYFATTGSL
jgi:hypothetical protein